MSTLDDLFSGSDGPHEPEPRRRPSRRRAVLLVVAAAALTAAVYLGLRLIELTAPVAALFAASVTLMMGLSAARGLRPPPPSRHAWRHHEERDVAPDGLRLAIRRWENMLDWCHTDVARFNRRVLPRLGELTDERLRLRHGVTRTSDPDRARAILGDPLWTQVTMPSRRPPSPRELDQIVSALEKL